MIQDSTEAILHDAMLRLACAEKAAKSAVVGELELRQPLIALLAAVRTVRHFYFRVHEERGTICPDLDSGLPREWGRQ